MARRKSKPAEAPALDGPAHGGTGLSESLEVVSRMLGHRFAHPELLERALTHRSWAYETSIAASSGEHDRADPSHDNEQLEFLGDAVLGLLAAEALCQRLPGSREGELTRLRANLVSRKHLGDVGTRLALGRVLRLGETAERNRGRDNPTLAANAMEALIAALYLDGGLAPARRFVEKEILAPTLGDLERSIAASDTLSGGGFSGAVGDHKSALQELVQAEGLGRPRYILAGEEGPDHRRTFRIEVRLEGPGAEHGLLAEASGASKKQAQQEAARLALITLIAAGVGAPGLVSGPAE